MSKLWLNTFPLIMIRKLTAFILLWLMTVVVITAQPGVMWCLIEHKVFVGDCQIQQSGSRELDSTCDQPTCCSAHEEPELTKTLQSPDCCHVLQMDLGDYLSASPASDSLPKNNPELFSLPHGQAQHFSPPLPPKSLPEIRGSPPPDLLYAVPLRLRFSVYRI